MRALLLLQVNVGEESAGKEESLTTVEVQVESSSIAAVCGLHHAMLRRVQVQTYRHFLLILGLGMFLKTNTHGVQLCIM